jgi:hypothetical protein
LIESSPSVWGLAFVTQLTTVQACFVVDFKLIKTLFETQDGEVKWSQRLELEINRVSTSKLLSALNLIPQSHCRSSILVTLNAENFFISFLVGVQYLFFMLK